MTAAVVKLPRSSGSVSSTSRTAGFSWALITCGLLGWSGPRRERLGLLGGCGGSRRPVHAAAAATGALCPAQGSATNVRLPRPCRGARASARGPVAPEVEGRVGTLSVSARAGTSLRTFTRVISRRTGTLAAENLGHVTVPFQRSRRPACVVEAVESRRGRPDRRVRAPRGGAGRAEPRRGRAFDALARPPACGRRAGASHRLRRRSSCAPSERC